jgi:hypothetical protein
MSEWFHVGQEVVCVDDSGQSDQPPPYISKGAIYTVARAYMTDEFIPVLMLELVELPFPETDDYFAGFEAEYFRPLRKRTTSIEVFKALLNPNKEPVEA